MKSIFHALGWCGLILMLIGAVMILTGIINETFWGPGASFAAGGLIIVFVSFIVEAIL